MTGRAALQARADALAARIGAPPGAASLFAASPGDGRPHLAPDGDAWRLIFMERGTLTEDRRGLSADAVLYTLFSDVTRDMAQAWELRHRKAGEDPRRGAFARQIALMQALSPRWAARLSAEIDQTLRAAPYADG